MNRVHIWIPKGKNPSLFSPPKSLKMTLINPIKLVKSNIQKNSHASRFFNLPLPISMFIIIFSSLIYKADAQIVNAQRSGFATITTEHVEDNNFGSGYTFYTAVWPIFKKYPGASNFQTGLGGTWLTSQRQPTDPEAFYHTIEGGLGWWGDTRFGTKWSARLE